MDFMNLNQAAHGDREFGYIQTRLGIARKTVAGHVSDPPWSTAGSARWVRAALGALRACARMRLARFGDNMRDVAVTEGDKVEAELRFGVSVNTYGVNDLVAGRRRGRRQRRRRAGRASTRTATTSRPSCAPAASGTSRCATARASSSACGRSSRTAASRAFTTNFEDLGGLRQLPGLAVQRLMADGYGFGGEGDWKTSVMLRTLKVMAAGPARRHVLHGGLHLPPGARRGADPRRAHARGLPHASPPAGRRWRSTRSASAAARTRSGWSSTRPRAPRSSSARPTWATGSGSSPTRSRSSRPTRRCRSCRSRRAVWRPAPDLRTSTEAWLTAGGPHHTVLSTALTSEHLWTSPR